MGTFKLISYNGAPYAHPYGGTAVDSVVTRDAFAERFGRVHDVRGLDDMPRNVKLFDVVGPRSETLGYIGTRDGRDQYQITTITF